MRREVAPERRANQLSGKDWLKNSVSVWSDLFKSSEERALKHPASFPEMLVSRLLSSFIPGVRTNVVILDPFMGSGSTLAAASKYGYKSIGFEVYEDYIAKAKTRLKPFEQTATASPVRKGGEVHGQYKIVNDSAANISKHIASESIDMVITSPPYWNILNRRRTADYKDIRTYGTDNSDLGNIDDYHTFLDGLIVIMRGVYMVLKPHSYCVVNVMDIRVKNKLYTFHSDLYARMEAIGFQLDDIIIWDRHSEYNNLRPLGYPYKFRINRVHEYLLIFIKNSS